MVRWIAIVFVVVAMCACQSTGGSFSLSDLISPPPTQSQGFVPTHGPTPVPSASVAADPPPPVEDPKQHAVAILERGAMIQALVKTAVDLDGSQDASRAATSIVPSCSRGRSACEQLTKEIAQRTKVGALGGFSLYLMQGLGGYTYAHSHGSPLPMDLEPILAVEPNLDEAEEFAKNAVAEAKLVADARATQEAKMNAEMADINAATIACESDRPSCEPKCKLGDAAYCVAYAIRLWKATKPAPKLEEAKAMMTRACKVGNENGCASVPKIDADIQAFAQQTNGLWDEVQRVGDDLATKKFQASLVKTYASSARNMRGVARMEQFSAALVREQYCPAKKALIEHSGVAEFTKRAKDHCKNDPPTASGLSGAEMVLNQQCTEVYATGCP